MVSHLSPCSMGRSRWRAATGVMLIGLGVLSAGCGSAASGDPVVTEGRRVQAATAVANGTSTYQIGAYELVFADERITGRHPRRAALLVDMFGGLGRVRGFAEWGGLGKPLETYVVGGWARQTSLQGELVTVFELVLNHMNASAVHREAARPEESTPANVRVVVHEASGNVTLTGRR